MFMSNEFNKLYAENPEEVKTCIENVNKYTGDEKIRDICILV